MTGSKMVAVWMNTPKGGWQLLSTLFKGEREAHDFFAGMPAFCLDNGDANRAETFRRAKYRFVTVDVPPPGRAMAGKKVK